MALIPPPDPDEGEEVLPWARAVGRFLRSIAPRESKDIWPFVTSTGTAYQLRRQPGGDGGPSGVVVYNDFSCSDASTPDGGTVVAITNGTVDSILPSGMSPGGTPPYTIGMSPGNNFIWLVISKDITSGLTTSVAIDKGDTVPADATDGSTSYRSLCDCNVTDTDVAIGSGQQGIGSQVTQLCGATVLWGPA